MVHTPLETHEKHKKNELNMNFGVINLSTLQRTWKRTQIDTETSVHSTLPKADKSEKKKKWKTKRNEEYVMRKAKQTSSYRRIAITELTSNFLFRNFFISLKVCVCLEMVRLLHVSFVFIGKHTVREIQALAWKTFSLAQKNRRRMERIMQGDGEKEKRKL